MATKVAKTGIERESGWLYYLDKKGNVSRARMARGGGKVRKTKPQLVQKAGVAWPCPFRRKRCQGPRKGIHTGYEFLLLSYATADMAEVDSQNKKS